MANHNGKHSFTTMMQYLSFYIFLNINFLLTYVIALNSYSFPFSDDRPLPTRVSSSEVGATALPQTERVESQQSTYNSPLYCEDDDVVIQSLDMTRLSIGKEAPESDDSLDDDHRCPVCFLQMLHPVKLPCNHIFCFLCVKVGFIFSFWISDWFVKSFDFVL